MKQLDELAPFLHDLNPIDFRLAVAQLGMILDAEREARDPIAAASLRPGMRVRGVAGHAVIVGRIVLINRYTVDVSVDDAPGTVRRLRASLVEVIE